MKAKKILTIGILITLVCSVGLAIAQAPSEKYVVIKAPLSPEEREDVYHILIGSIVYHSVDGITTVYTPNGECILKAKDSDAAMIATPHGTFVPVTHVIQSPSESSASFEPFEFYTEDRGRISTESATKIYAPDGTLLLTIISDKTEKEERSKYGGWIEQANDWTVDSLHEFTAYWKAPSYPPSPGNAYGYLFNAIEPSDGSKIIQPVLEWNYGGSSGRWTAASWWGPDENGDYHRSSPLEVSVGEKLKGELEWSTAYARWHICTYNLDDGTSTGYWPPNDFIGDTNLAVFTALEGYSIEDNTDVPGDTDFHDMTFEGDTPTWEGHVDENAPLTGLNVEIVSQPARVKLHTAN